LLWNFTSYSGERYAQDEPSYRINEVTIDFTRQRIKLKRIGNKTTALYNRTGGAVRPHGGRVRDEMSFPFKKQ
jgi:hypothetical protein